MIHSPNSFDVVIIGGGILGLWAARHAIKAGKKVCLVEKRKIGAGASGGFLGALMPHMPDGWDAKKQFQYEGLSTLPRAVADLEADTGYDCGYKMCGRIMPLPHEKMLQHMPIRTKGSKEFWGEGLDMVLYEDLSKPDAPHLELVEGWVNPEIARFGIQYDTFSARVNPRAYLAALEAYVRPRAEVREDVEVFNLVLRQAQDEVGRKTQDEVGRKTQDEVGRKAQDEVGCKTQDEVDTQAHSEVDKQVQYNVNKQVQNEIESHDSLTLSLSKGEGSVVQLANGDKIKSDKIIVANGYEAYPMLQPYMGDALNGCMPIGRGVKGQAVLVEFEHDDNLPIVYHDGVYVVPHANNKVAIGSTSRKDWAEPFTFDDTDMEFYRKAIEYVPALKNAPIIDRWAAVRPRNTLEGKGTDPYFAPVPGHDNLIALVGGFKITLGVAHVAGLEFI